jgi:hypothetical protein
MGAPDVVIVVLRSKIIIGAQAPARFSDLEQNW